MPSRLTEAHIEGEKRIREVTVRAVDRAWVGLPAYNRENVPEFLVRALPAVRAGVRASVNLTAAYLARAREEQPAGIDVERVIAGLRNGVPLEEVYSRPFVDVWSALADGALWADAVELGRDRAVTLAATDPQLAMRDTARSLDTGYGYQRVADGDACSFCQMVDGAYVKSGDAMPLHPMCGCSLEPLFEPSPLAVNLPDGVAVREHGELGPVLVDPAHNFKSSSDIP
jgi:hypothetical protein